MENQFLFTGIAPALVTPFTADNEIDEAAFRTIIRWQIDEGVDALVVLGTTGENPTITHKERRLLIDISLDETDGEVPVIIGTGTNNTAQSVTFSREAAQAGADGLLVVGPYYNKPNGAGFKQHVEAIANTTDCPIIIYNVPGRTGFNIPADLMLDLAESIPTVIGSKEASGNLAQISDILAHRPDDLAVYAGDDEMTLPLLALGAEGVVSVIANALPGTMSDFVRTALDDSVESARTTHFRILKAMRACFYASNPLPIKHVMAKQGLLEARARLPLGTLTDDQKKRVIEAFQPLLG